MGGLGSTRWRYQSVKALVEETPKICVKNYLSHLDHHNFIILAVQNRQNGTQQYRQRIQVDRRPLARGGYDLRWVCGCGRRCRILYFTKSHICCQKCGQLVHRSTRTSHDFGFESLFRKICREENITGLTFGRFIKHFKQK
jgi:hypothetical protein